MAWLGGGGVQRRHRHVLLHIEVLGEALLLLSSVELEKGLFFLVIGGVIGRREGVRGGARGRIVVRGGNGVAG